MTGWQRKRVLVAGGAGFLGSHLCAALLRQGHAVLCVDNLRTGSTGNLASLLAHPAFELLRHDVGEPLHAEVDMIYNLACPASPRHYQRDPIKTVRTSVLGALNLLELAHRQRAPILQASTSEVYGDPEQHPQPESYWGRVNPVGPRACYDEGKRCAETLFMEYQRQYGLPVKIVRIFNTYGPHMHPDDGRVVSNFVTQALAGAPITLYGSGSQTRSFCYVDDMVDALLRTMDTPDDVCGPLNLGNPAEVTMLELAKTVRALCGSSSVIESRPAPGDDPVRRKPDISLARQLLGWSPRTGLHDGLLRTIDYFRKLSSGPCPSGLPGDASAAFGTLATAPLPT
ncbi:MAG TPA: UDP-glucuronic acid decarboxylase family protein [Telluria sp.]|nr:UDP-glucuronic acid decarboxylase family protein [Telluria sp.]